MTTKSSNVYEKMMEFEGIERVEAHLRWFNENLKDPKKEEWVSAIIPHLSVVSCSTAGPRPSATFRFTPQPVHGNAVNGMHGGCTSTVFDHCTSLALSLLARPGFWQYLGVSRTLSVTYLRPVPIGAPVDVECEVVHAGRRLVALRGVMRAAAAGAGAHGPVLAICEHGKVSTDPPVGGKL